LDIAIGTWNVRTLYKAAALKTLLQQISPCKIKVLAVQETCWTGQAIWNTKYHTILSNGKENGPREAGTAFIVEKLM
jgi:hypothetical protein